AQGDQALPHDDRVRAEEHGERDPEQHGCRVGRCARGTDAVADDDLAHACSVPDGAAEAAIAAAAWRSGAFGRRDWVQTSPSAPRTNTRRRFGGREMRAPAPHIVPVLDAPRRGMLRTRT